MSLYSENKLLCYLVQMIQKKNHWRAEEESKHSEAPWGPGLQTLTVLFFPLSCRFQTFHSSKRGKLPQQIKKKTHFLNSKVGLISNKDADKEKKGRQELDLEVTAKEAQRHSKKTPKRRGNQETTMSGVSRVNVHVTRAPEQEGTENGVGAMHTWRLTLPRTDQRQDSPNSRFQQSPSRK